MDPADTPAALSPITDPPDGPDGSAVSVSEDAVRGRSDRLWEQHDPDVPEIGHKKSCAVESSVRYAAPASPLGERLPIIDQPGMLSLQLPSAGSLDDIRRFLANSRYEHWETSGILQIQVSAGEIAPLLSPLLDLMSAGDREGTLAIFQPDSGVLATGRTPEPFEITSLTDFANQSGHEWLLRLMGEDRLYSVFQPILCCGTLSDPGNPVTLNNRGAVFGYECLLRGRSGHGETLLPGPLLKMAQNVDLLVPFDVAARRAAIRSSAARGIADDHKVFINFVPHGIDDPHISLESTVTLIDSLGIQRSQVVFEIIESQRLPETDQLRRITGYCRQQGFGVALDDVGAGFSSLSVLASLRPDFVKLDRSLLHRVQEDKARALVARKLLEMVHELDLQSIAEGIETEAEFAWAKEHGADYVQGYLFARPAESPPLRP